MKPIAGFLALCGGFALSFGMFVGGMGAATYLITVEETGQPGPSVDLSDLWTSRPRTVDTAKQERMLERLPAVVTAPVEPDTGTGEEVRAETEPGFQRTDPMATASVENGSEEEDIRQAQLAAAHVEWCRARYRSYDEVDDSYTSYSGEQRPCVSPFTREAETMRAEGGGLGLEPTVSLAEGFADAGDPDLPVVHYASDAAEAGYLTEDHISDCFSRYRSYRPEDNSYQPYGGGPRQQCN